MARGCASTARRSDRERPGEGLQGHTVGELRRLELGWGILHLRPLSQGFTDDPGVGTRIPGRREDVHSIQRGVRASVVHHAAGAVWSALVGIRDGRREANMKRVASLLAILLATSGCHDVMPKITAPPSTG